MAGIHPRLSVIIPVYNGTETIGQCLSALAESSFQNFETIVVDDGSTDDSAVIAARFNVRLIHLKHNSGPAAARNVGVSASSAPLLFFLDDDIIVPPSFLERAVDVLESRREFSALFCSFSRETVPTNTCSRHKNLVHHWAHQTAAAEAATFCGGFGLIRRAAFLAMDGFDSQQRFLEDVDLGYRLHRSGHRILLMKDIQATHAKVYTLASFLRSDLFALAVPWTRLILKYRIVRNDLNTRIHNVLSVLATCLLPLSIALDPFFRLTAALTLFFLWLNWSYLRFAVREYGFVFAVQSAFLCWLSYLASGVGVCVGVGSWLRDWCCSYADKLLANSRSS